MEMPDREFALQTGSFPAIYIEIWNYYPQDLLLRLILLEDTQSPFKCRKAKLTASIWGKGHPVVAAWQWPILMQEHLQ